MASAISPAKIVLLAVHFASHADIDNLAIHTAQHRSILRSELILRILLTHLPETLQPDVYTNFLQSIATGDFSSYDSNVKLDTSPVDGITDDQASGKVRKLHLLSLLSQGVSDEGQSDSLTSFLFARGYRMDQEAGMLTDLPNLLLPFLQHTPAIQTWLVSTIKPLLRRNHDYYPQKAVQYSLLEFQELSDHAAVNYLLSLTGVSEDSYSLVGRDLRGMIGPWLYDEKRWKKLEAATDADGNLGSALPIRCPGWEHVLEWLISQALKSWKVALHAIQDWEGPEDVDLGDNVSAWLDENRQRYLDRGYARAALACAYLIPEGTLEALEGAYRILSKIRSLMDQGQESSLESITSTLPQIPSFENQITLGPKSTTHMRNDLLDDSNPLTSPKRTSIDILLALILSASLLTRTGLPCTVRRAGDLAFIQDLTEQKGEITRFLRSVVSQSPKNDDDYWIHKRQELLWLRSWGRSPGDESENPAGGVFGMVPREYIETEFLKALLSNSRYSLARTIYEDATDSPLPATVIQATVQSSALGAFDNATNPNRTRGGLKKCDEIIHAFPKTMDKSLLATRRIESLLKATHSLSDYRLVLKQGEPFSPVVLRVHSDPISIIEKVLEQNPQAYTRLQEFLEMGNNIVKAGLLARLETDDRRAATQTCDQNYDTTHIEKRIVAMCIESALKEDDFETAYSYVVSRLSPPPSSISEGDDGLSDQWSWSAALKAGQYVRTERSQKPTHLGTASGNPEIRHLEQRIKCLATALRIAPPSQLQEVLKTFRRCEEQLDSAIKEEAAREDAWDAAGDYGDVPGSFDTSKPKSVHPPRNMTASASIRQVEEAPMSLFDLSRATAHAAQRNFTTLSSLQDVARGMASMTSSQTSDADNHDQQHRARKRDQLREAATGTLVSGVGWLIGASVNRGNEGTR